MIVQASLKADRQGNMVGTAACVARPGLAQDIWGLANASNCRIGAERGAVMLFAVVLA